MKPSARLLSDSTDALLHYVDAAVAAATHADRDLVKAARISRRRLLRISGALGGLAVAAPLASAFAAEENNKWTLGEGTPATTAGPFYPLLNKPAHPGTDLATPTAGGARAQGQLLYLMGQVLDVKGKPVRGAKIEIWQANAAGRYDHPSDGNPAPLDPNFQGYGVVVTDGEGRYRFRTIKPGAYPVTKGWDRPPHIHFEVTGRKDLEVAQIFFPDDPLNAQDRLFNGLPPAAQKKLTCSIEAPSKDMEPDAKTALFNIVLTNG